MKKRYILLIILVIIGLVGYFGFDFWVNTTVRSILKHRENQAYIIEFDHVKLRLFKRELAIYGVQVQDSAKSEGIHVRMKVAEARMDSIDIKALIFKRSLDIRSFVLDKPEIVIFGVPKEKARNPENEGLKGLFAGIIGSGKIRNFELREGSLQHWRNRDEEGNPDARISGFTLQAIGIESDQVQLGGIIPFKVKDIHQRIEKAVYTLGNGEILTVDSVDILGSARKVEVGHIRLNFPKPWLQVSDSIGAQVSIIEAEMGPVLLERIDVGSELFESGTFIAGLLTIENLALKVHRDKRKPRVNIHVQENFNPLAQDIALHMGIDSIIVKGGYVYYTQMGPKRDHPATLPFSLKSAYITNLTTIDSLQHKPLHVHALAGLDGHGSIVFDMVLPYNSASMSVNAQVKNLDLTHLNGTLKDMLGVEIEQGNLHSLELVMNANSYTSSNKLEFQYEDLSIVLLDKSKDEEASHIILSAIANLAVRSHNLPDSKSYRTAVYSTERDRTRGMFNLIWACLSDGLQEIAVSNSAAKIKKGVSIFKKNDKDKQSNSKTDKKAEKKATKKK